MYRTQYCTGVYSADEMAWARQGCGLDSIVVQLLGRIGCYSQPLPLLQRQRSQDIKDVALETYTMYNVHCIVYTVHCTLYTVHCTLYTVHCTLYTVHCTLYTVYCTLYTVHCTPYTMYTVHCTVYSVHCTLYIVHCTVYSYRGIQRLASNLVWEWLHNSSYER